MSGTPKNCEKSSFRIAAGQKRSSRNLQNEPRNPLEPAKRQRRMTQDTEPASEDPLSERSLSEYDSRTRSLSQRRRKSTPPRNAQRASSLCDGDEASMEDNSIESTPKKTKKTLGDRDYYIEYQKGPQHDEQSEVRSDITLSGSEDDCTSSTVSSRKSQETDASVAKCYHCHNPLHIRQTDRFQRVDISNRRESQPCDAFLEGQDGISQEAAGVLSLPNDAKDVADGMLDSLIIAAASAKFKTNRLNNRADEDFVTQNLQKAATCLASVHARLEHDDDQSNSNLGAAEAMLGALPASCTSSTEELELRGPDSGFCAIL